jgi:ribonuclease VapC
MARVVFDASAVLALLNEEPGSEVVATYVGDAIISAVNYQEVVYQLLKRGISPATAELMLIEARLEVVPHDEKDASMAAMLGKFTHKFGCGLGDRTCLALALRKGLPVLTTDQVWANLEIPDLKVLLAR